MSHAESVLFDSFFPNKRCHNNISVIFKARAAIKVKAAIIVVFTSAGLAVRCVPTSQLYIRTRANTQE